jgi:hypothetical protein
VYIYNIKTLKLVVNSLWDTVTIVIWLNLSWSNVGGGWNQTILILQILYGLSWSIIPLLSDNWNTSKRASKIGNWTLWHKKMKEIVKNTIHSFIKNWTKNLKGLLLREKEDFFLNLFTFLNVFIITLVTTICLAIKMPSFKIWLNITSTKSRMFIQ